MSLLRLVVLTLSAAPLLAQGLELRSDVDRAWRSLQASSPSDPWHVQVARAAGTPRAVFGPGLRIADSVVTEDDARRLVDALLRDQAALLGVGASELEPQLLTQVGQTWISVHRQRFRGLEVIGGRADVRLKSNGVVSMFGGVLFEIAGDFDVQPRLSAELAVAIACNEHQARPARDDAAAQAPQLVIWADAAAQQRVTPCLAWQVPLTGVAGTRERGVAFLDARSGAVLDYRRGRFALHAGATSASGGIGAVAASPRAAAPRREPEVAAVRANVAGTVMAFVSDHIGPNGTPHNVPLAGVMVQVAGGGSAYTDAAGGFDIAHTGTAPVGVQVSLQGGEYVGPVQTAAGVTLQLSQNVTPGTPAVLQLTTSTSSVADLQLASAYYLIDRAARFVRQPHVFGGNPVLVALDGIPVRVMDANLDCEAQFLGGALEFGTGTACGGSPMAFSTVVEHEWGHALDEAFGGLYVSGDGLEEGYADVLANLITGQPLIGLDFPLPGQVLRDANNGAQYPSGTTQHERGLTWMGGCWAAREVFSAAVGAAGIQHAETILIGALAANPVSQPAALLEVYVLDDDDGSLNNGTPYCSLLSYAFTSLHGIPAPLQTCSTNPGVAAQYGAGCPGSGLLPVSCEQVNPAGGQLLGGAAPSWVFAFAVDCTAAHVVQGIEMFTRSATGGTNATVALHADANGTPASSPLQVATMVVGLAPAFYSATFATPVNVQAGDRLWVVVDGSVMESPLLTQGATPMTPTLGDFGLGAGWIPMTPDFPSWRLSCAGVGQPGAVPRLHADSLPAISQPLQLSVSSAAPSSFGVLAFGLSATNHLGVSLPFSLAGLGAPGCEVLAAPEALFPFLIDPAGDGGLSWTLPNQPSAVDLHVFVQALVVDPLTNSLGLVVSNGLDLEIGTP